MKAVSGTAYTAPRNETEKAIAAIWQDVLNVEKAGIFDNFFETGGHSLKAMTLLTKIHKETGIEIPLQFLFEHPTITALAEEADHRESKAFAVIEPAENRSITRFHWHSSEHISSASSRMRESAITCQQQQFWKGL